MSLAQKNDGSVYDGIQYTSSVVLPKNGATPTPSLKAGYSPLRRLRRVASNMVIALSVVIMGVLGTGGASEVASANWFTDAIKGVFCGPEAYFNEPEMYTSGPTGLGFSPSRYIGKVKDLFNTGDPNFNSERRTAYEKYGMSGATWTVYRGHEDAKNVLEKSGNYSSLSDDAKNRLNQDLACVPFIEVLSTYAANQMFSLTKTLTAISTATYSAAYSADMMDQFTESVAGVIEGSAEGNGLRDVLYFEFLGVMLMFGAVYLAWVGLVKRSSTTAGSAAIWMVGAVVVGSFLVYNPTVIPRSANAIVNEVTGAIMTGTTGMAIPAGQTENNSLCYLPRTNTIDGQERITRVVECSLWSAFVYTPWVSGQFGTSPSVDLSVEGSVAPTIEIGRGKEVTRNWALYQLEQQSLDLYSIATNRAGMVAEKQDNWGLVRDHMAEHKPELWDSWNGKMSGERLGVASLAAVAAIAGLAVILVLSVLMIVYQLGLVLLMFVAPLFLLVGAHPGFGRGIALRWAELVVGTILKRILVSALLGVMVAFYSIILGGANPQNESYDYGTAMIMIIAISIAGLIYRKTLTEAFSNVRFGGTNAGIEHSPHSVRQGGAILAGTATGLLTGGLAAGKVAAAAGGGKAGMAAALRTVAKSGTEGAQRGAYAMSPKAAVAGAVRSGSRTAKSEMASVESTKRQKAAREQAHMNMLNEAYSENERRDNALLEEAYAENARRDAVRAQEADPSHYAAQQERQRQQRQREIQEFLKNKDDAGYMTRLQAKHGGRIPSYLLNAERNAAGTRPESRSSTESSGSSEQIPGQGTLLDENLRPTKDTSAPVQGTLFDMKDTPSTGTSGSTGSGGTTRPQPSASAATPSPASGATSAPQAPQQGGNTPGSGAAPTRRSALPNPMGVPSVGGSGEGVSAEVAREMREVRRDIRNLADDSQARTRDQNERIERIQKTSDQNGRRRPPPPPQPPRARG